MVDVPETSDPDCERPVAAGPGHVKKMISLFSNGLIINGNEPALSNVNGRTQVIRSEQYAVEVMDEPTSPSKSSTDELDNCIRTNYVASRILNFEGIGNIDQSRPKKASGKLPSCWKVNGLAPARTSGNRDVTSGSAGDGNHVIATEILSTADDSKLQNGYINGEELYRSNGFDHRCDEETSDHICDDETSDHRCGETSVSNGAITYRNGVDSGTRHTAQQNGFISGSQDFQQMELVAVTEDGEAKPTENGHQDNSMLMADNLKKDGNYYLEIVNKEEKCLQATVSQMQTLLDSDPDIPEEASGLIRAAVGKGNLLIRKKFTHYRDCCIKNLHPDPAETRHTTDADLAGLWDIVCIQIADINAMSAEIETLKKNDWKMEKVEKATLSQPAKPHLTRTRKTKTTANKCPSKDDKASKARDEARAKAREEAKKRLLAAKKAGRQRKASQSDDVEIYVPG